MTFIRGPFISIGRRGGGLINILNEMKYPLQTINLVAATPKVVTTTLTTEPYSIMVLDSSGNEITATVEILVEFTGGVYVVTLESSESLNGVKLKILY